jgi:hypothetical protein
VVRRPAAGRDEALAEERSMTDNKANEAAAQAALGSFTDRRSARLLGARPALPRMPTASQPPGQGASLS